jgi:hypothetical protein
MKFSYQFVWLLGAYRLPNSFELYIYLEGSTPCNCRESCNTCSETLLQNSYDTLIQTYEGRDLQIGIVLVAVKKPRSTLYAQYSLLCYTQNIQTNRKFLQRDKINTKTFLSVMPRVLKISARVPSFVPHFKKPIVYFTFT